MAHEVRVRIDTALIANKDFEIIVKSSEGKVGTLLISKGNIEWLPKGYSVNKRRLTWQKFSEVMQAQGKLAKV
jgi:hypothetical protein